MEQLIQELGNNNIEITVMTLNPENVKGYFPDNVNIYPFPTFFCWSLFRAASAHHMAILCEGSTLTPSEAQTLHHTCLPDNLYIADASLLPQSLGLPPMLTIMALAKRISKIIIQ